MNTITVTLRMTYDERAGGDRCIAAMRAAEEAVADVLGAPAVMIISQGNKVEERTATAKEVAVFREGSMGRPANEG